MPVLLTSATTRAADPEALGRDLGAAAEKRGKVRALIAKHAQAITGLRERVA